MSRVHRVLGGLALAAGLLAVFAGSPYVAKHVTALELARWIRDRRPGLRVIDLRPAADFDTYHVPGARNVPIASLELSTLQPDETVVLISDGSDRAAQAWLFGRTIGHRNIVFLSGGIDAWLDSVMNPNGSSQETAALSRYFGGVPRSSDVKRPSTAAAVRRRGC